MSILHVDRYVLCEPIAVGGMATVYFARQRGAAGFSKAVAIKRMRPDLVHQREFVDLFVDEARLASRVRHANVVSVIDVVASGEELLLVMEYFHGESLARLLASSRNKSKDDDKGKGKSRRVPPEIAVALVCNVLRGLHAAHEAKGEKGEALDIVHRDVSPQNILVGVDGVARVADFGIARAAGQIHATDEGKTRGKAGYSAPEQLRGGTVTRKIDLFAACALLWEMLVGRRLFEGESQAAVVTAVLTEPIEAPGLLVPELPEELDALILRGLDRTPKNRPETALELASALERIVSPASPNVVAAWVVDLAREDLDKREAIVRRIEAGDFETAATPALPGSSSSVDARASNAAGAGAAAAALDPGTGSLATSRSPSAAPSPRRSKVMPIALGMLGVAVVIGVISSFAIKGGSDGATTTTTTTTGPTTPSAPLSSLSTMVMTEPVDVPVTSLATSGATTASAPPSASAPRIALSSKQTPPARASVSPPPRAPSKRCDPPYDLDPAGRKIFRVECL